MKNNSLNEYSSATSDGRTSTKEERDLEYSKRRFGWKETPKEKTMSDEEFGSITDEIFASMDLEDQDRYQVEWYLRNRRDINVISERLEKRAEEVKKKNMKNNKLNEYSSASNDDRNDMKNNSTKEERDSEYSKRRFGLKQVPKEKTMSDEEFDSITDEIYSSMDLEDQDRYQVEWYLRNRRNSNAVWSNMDKDAEIRKGGLI